MGGLVLLFFSSMAFRVLEDAIAIIFHRPLPTLKRKFWVSALIPYLFILIVAAVISLIVGSIEHGETGWIDGVAILIAVIIVATVSAAAAAPALPIAPVSGCAAAAAASGARRRRQAGRKAQA